MVRIYKKAKTFLLFLVILYLLLTVYRVFQNITEERRRAELLGKISDHPLCTVHGSVFKRLHRLAKDLIYVRMAINGDPAMVKRIDKHYDNLQSLLREIELISNNQSSVEKHTNTTEIQETQDQISHVVCPEIYHGTTFGYPIYGKGFETTNCSKHVPLQDLVTLIFDDVPVAMRTDEGEVIANDLNYPEKMSDFFSEVDQFYFGIKTYVVLNKTNQVMSALKRKIKTGITKKFIQIGSRPRGSVLQGLIDQVDTPYVLIASQLSHFTNEVNLERLVRVLSTKNATHFAGGSSRNLTGHWSNNCNRVQLKNYTLTYKSGYSTSYSECLVCDHLEGPFLTKTKTLQTVKFDSSLNHGVYKDLFLRIKYQHGYLGNAVLSCPDVMFHTQKKALKDVDLLPFANRHAIRKIVEDDGNLRWYGCRSGIEHREGDRCTIRNGLAVAPCCLENLADAVKFIMSECDSSNAICELQEGTLLGAVKLNKVLPWERDADITFLTSDYDKLKEIRRAIEERGYLFLDISSPRCCVEDRMAGGKLEVLADGWSIQLYGQHKMDSERLTNRGIRPTKVLFSGQWVNVPENPGKHLRNRYGLDIYRHAEHWMATGAESGWIQYDTKGFSTCPVKGFHGCLDQYMSDGSLQFENMF